MLVFSLVGAIVRDFAGAGSVSVYSASGPKALEKGVPALVHVLPSGDE